MMKHDTTRRPERDEYVDYFGRYISRVPDGKIVDLLQEQIAEFRSVLDSMPTQAAQQLHAPYTWTIKQVVGHLIDVEKVFGYRAHRFACGDARPIPGMEQDEFVANTDYQHVQLSPLINELELARRSNVMFLRRIAPEAWDRRGTADGSEISVRAIAFVLVGHVIHHLDIIRTRLVET